MLTQIQIKDFALIDDLSLELSGGFNVLTGETGAGKSIIVDAITAVLGERASGDVVRTGAEKATIEAAFDLSGNPEACEKAVELGVDVEDGMLIVSREVSAGGRSQGRVNGRLSTLTMLKDLTSGLIDVHGQHEHQTLLSVDQHLEILDRWCGKTALDLRLKVSELYSQLRSLRLELDRLQKDERERSRLLDLYAFQKSEIEAAKLVPGEEEELGSERTRLASAEKLQEHASAAYAALSGVGGEGGATDLLSTALAELRAMAALDNSTSATLQDIETALYATEQAQNAVRSYRDEVEFNPSRLEEIEERLHLIRTLKRKYGESIEQIIAYGQEVERKSDDLAHSEERIAELTREIEHVEDQLLGAARRLSDERKAGASQFTQSVEAELAELAMANSKFDISFTECEPGEQGMDNAEFVISPNPGEPLKPLAAIASGGEMSRIMLALKTVMAGADKVPTLIFDEIDTGIGGRTSQVLGQKLAAVAKSAQVICVTHLPQIASHADHQFSVEKGMQNERTVVRVKRIEGEERVDELARMLGGSEGSATAVEHAREMLEAAGQYPACPTT